MKKNNLLLFTLAIALVLVISTFSVSSYDSEKSNVESLEVVKEIYDEGLWVDEIDATIGETVRFRITVTYYNITDPAHYHYADKIVVTDSLPDCLEYDSGSSEPFEPEYSSALNQLVWRFDDPLLDGESLVITFNTTVVSYGVNINLAEADADEICTGQEIHGEDTATVNVISPNPGIDTEKKVFDGICNWVEEIYADKGSIVRFNITVENTGKYDLYINDTLPDSLEFADNVWFSITPDSSEVDSKDTSWYYDEFPENQIIFIQFDALVVGDPCSVDVNWVDVKAKTECYQEVTDEDDATVKVKGMCLEKEVWDDETDSWMDETNAEVGNKVKFRIKIKYLGSLSLKNMHIRDELPNCLGYVEGSSIPDEPEISSDGKTLWWNLTDVILYHEDTYIIEFETRVFSNNCEPCENLVNITASECGQRTVYGDDTATVIIECGFDADAGGPYYGDINEDIKIYGSANDGTPPYTFEWDLDDDGEYDDATGEEITWSWDEPGNYLIYLLVTDDGGDTAGAYASVEIGVGENDAPNKPDIQGKVSGLVPNATYTYKFTSTDPDGDDVWYFVDWGDGEIKNWIGPYKSGETVNLTHSFSDTWTSYNIRAKAKDTFDQESPWGTLTVKTPKSKLLELPLLNLILQRLIDRFPILEHFFNI